MGLCWMSNRYPQPSGEGGKCSQTQTPRLGNRKGYTALPIVNYRLFGIEHSELWH